MKCIEERLYNYEILKTKIKIIDIDINRQYISDEEIRKLQVKKISIVEEKTKLDEALNSLSILENQIVKLRYFSRNKMTWEDIATHIGYSTDYCKKLRRTILKKLTSILNN